MVTIADFAQGEKLEAVLYQKPKIIQINETLIVR
jgi:hypothetical protein